MDDEHQLQQKYQRYAGWFVGGMILLLLGTIIVSRLYGDRGGATLEHVNVAAKCAAVAGISDTIFAILPGTTTPQAIAALYTRAMCPRRVFVAVSDNAAYEKLSSSSHTVAHHVISQNTKRILGPMMTAAAGTPEGAGRALWDMLYRSEMFVAVFSPDMVDITQDWDQRLIDQLRRKIFPHENPRIVLTSKTSDISGGCPVYLYRDTAADVACRPLHHSVPSHSRVKQMFASHDFIFTYAAAFQEVPYHRGTDEADFMLSLRLWCAGWDFYVPEVCVYHQHQDRQGRQGRARRRKPYLIVIKDTLDQVPSTRRRTPREFLTDYLGVSDLSEASALTSPRQHTGIVDENDRNEIIIKYGSHEKYFNQAASPTRL